MGTSFCDSQIFLSCSISTVTRESSRDVQVAKAERARNAARCWTRHEERLDVGVFVVSFPLEVAGFGQTALTRIPLLAHVESVPIPLCLHMFTTSA